MLFWNYRILCYAQKFQREVLQMLQNSHYLNLEGVRCISMPKIEMKQLWQSAAGWEITTTIQFSAAPAAWGSGTHSTGWAVHDLLAFRAQCCHTTTINAFHHRLLGYKLRQLRSRTNRLLLLLLGGICSSWQRRRCTVESSKSLGSFDKSEKYCKSKVQYCLSSLIKLTLPALGHRRIQLQTSKQQC